MGAQALRADPRGGQKIGIIGMEHHAVDCPLAEIGRTSAAHPKIQINGADLAIGRIANLPIHPRIMTLAGQNKILVAIKPDLARPSRMMRRQSRQGRPLRGLRLLAAKATAQTPHLAAHQSLGQIQHPRHTVLHFGRVLGGADELHLAPLTRHGHGNLAFQIKMFLSADPLLAAQAQIRQRQRRGIVFHAEMIIWQHFAALLFGLLDGDKRRFRVDLNDSQTRGTAGKITRFRDNHK